MNENLYTIALLILLAVSCLTLGVLLLYAHTIMPGLKRLDDATFVRSFRAIDGAIINPFFMLQFFGPLLLFGVLYFVALSNGYSEAMYLLLGGIAYFAVIALTMAVNVPLNDGIKRINPSGSAESLSQGRVAFNERRWVFANNLRALANASAIVFVIIALVVHN